MPSLGTQDYSHDIHLPKALKNAPNLITSMHFYRSLPPLKLFKCLNLLFNEMEDVASIPVKLVIDLCRVEPWQLRNCKSRASTSGAHTQCSGQT
jgi:hypothetical protein